VGFAGHPTPPDAEDAPADFTPEGGAADSQAGSQGAEEDGEARGGGGGGGGEGGAAQPPQGRLLTTGRLWDSMTLEEALQVRGGVGPGS
jgi:hypothetical protein